MSRCGTIKPNSPQKWMAVLWLSIVLSVYCGCSTAQPELTPEERIYNEQLKLQGNAKPSSPSPANSNALESIGKILSDFSQVFAYVLAGTHGDTDHHQ